MCVQVKSSNLQSTLIKYSKIQIYNKALWIKLLNKIFAQKITVSVVLPYIYCTPTVESSFQRIIKKILLVGII